MLTQSADLTLILELIMKNIFIKAKEKDYRYPMVFDDVQNLKMEEIKIEGENKSDYFIFKNVKRSFGEKLALHSIPDIFVCGK